MTREEELQELEYREGRKVKKFKYGYGVRVRTLIHCPTCGERLDELDKPDYCPYCGQKLDWSVLND